MVDETRRIARQAAKLQWVADEYRKRARRGAADRRSLEQQARTLDRMAACLLSLRIGRVAGGSLSHA
jgi:hypothetical protein